MSAKPVTVQPVLKSRLLPRISLGFLFVLTTLGALLATVARAAGQGAAVAIAALSGIAFLAICFATFAALFSICRMVAYLKADRIADAGSGNPFAEGQLPPQILPPREPRS